MRHYENGQWAVDDFGLVSIEPGAPYEYQIAAGRLLEKAGAGGGELYDWPIQVTGKTWVDNDAFFDAYRRAIEIHAGAYQGTVDQDLLERSIAAAKKRADFLRR